MLEITATTIAITVVEKKGWKKSCSSFCKRRLPYLLPVAEQLKDQLKEPLIGMLLFSAGISIILGNTSDAISIGIALFIVSLVAAVQEYRSEKALEALENLVPHKCTVLRDGRVLADFPAKELVVGDLVLLATGDRVPADCRVVDSVELRIDESSLTGENHPVAKTGEGLNVSNIPSLPQQRNIAFAGVSILLVRVADVFDDFSLYPLLSDLPLTSCSFPDFGQRRSWSCSSGCGWCTYRIWYGRRGIE